LNYTVNCNYCFVNPTKHCHDSCPQKAEANMALVSMRQDMKSTNTTPLNVLGNGLSKLSNEVLANLPKKSSLERNLLNHRTDDHLINPTTVNFSIPETYSDLILYDTGMNDPNRILAFGSKDLLVELNKGTIYGDGTFDKVPNMFYQLYTWHVQIGNSTCYYKEKIYLLISECWIY